MARYQKGKSYNQQDERYRKNNTRDMFRGQRDMKERRMAGRKLMEKKGVDRMRDLPEGVRPRFAENNPISFIGDARDEGKQYYDDGRLRDISDKKNPFKNIDRYTGAEYGRGSQRGREFLTTGDIQGLKNIGGHDKQKIVDFAEASDAEISGNAQNLLDRWKKAIMEAENENDNPAPPGTSPGVDDVPNLDLSDSDHSMANLGDGVNSQMNNNKLDKGAALAGPNGVAVGGNQEATNTDIFIAGPAYGDVGANIDKSRTYINPMGGGSGTGYESGLGLGQQYIDNMEANMDEYSGEKYGIKVTDMFMENASNPVGYRGLWDEAGGKPLAFMDLATQWDAANYGSARNRMYNPGDWEMPDEPEDLRDKVELLEGIVG